MRLSLPLAIVGLIVCCGRTTAQTPGILYTWAGTGNVHDWVAGSSLNNATVTNSTPGQLRIVETGDPLEPFDPGLSHVIRDGFNRRLESSTEIGGLDVWGLEAIEIDLAHNSSGTVNVEFFVQATPDFTWLQGGSDGMLSRNFTAPDWSLGPGMHTIRIPVNQMMPNEQAYLRTVGVQVRNHSALGNLTWNIFEVRSVGTAPTERVLASHDIGTSDNGLNGAFVNYGNDAVVGNNGGQNQTGLSQNTTGSGSLRWTDRGTGGVTGAPSGAAISWVNGTFHQDNSFNQRLADFSNYDTVTFRMSATDSLNGGGNLGVQAFFQTDNYNHQTTSGGAVGQFGEIPLPIDGQYHDLVFPMAGLVGLRNVQTFGISLFDHLNALTINVDSVRFNEVELFPGDYNDDGNVDAADYVVWRKAQGTGVVLPNDPHGGTIGAQQYSTWQTNFGNMLQGSGAGSGQPVPEPTALVLLISVIAVTTASRLRVRW